MAALADILFGHDNSSQQIHKTVIYGGKFSGGNNASKLLT